VLSILRLLSGQHLCFFLFDQHRVLARNDRLPLDSRLGLNPVGEVKPSFLVFQPAALLAGLATANESGAFGLRGLVALMEKPFTVGWEMALRVLACF
jgi:hypothetical protein